MTWPKRRCLNCGRMISTNALGRAAHERSCYTRCRVYGLRDRQRYSTRCRLPVGHDGAHEFERERKR